VTHAVYFSSSQPDKNMNKVVIEWGNIERTEAIEKNVFEKATKVLTFAPQATRLLVSFQVINPKTSAGLATQRVSMELRLPHHQDIRAEREGDNLYQAIKEAEQALLSQLNSQKR
jgi:ribosomal subunit interface protein